MKSKYVYCSLFSGLLLIFFTLSCRNNKKEKRDANAVKGFDYQVGKFKGGVLYVNKKNFVKRWSNGNRTVTEAQLIISHNSNWTQTKCAEWTLLKGYKQTMSSSLCI